jgi:hypothetical protein
VGFVRRLERRKMRRGTVDNPMIGGADFLGKTNIVVFFLDRLKNSLSPAPPIALLDRLLNHAPGLEPPRLSRWIQFHRPGAQQINP